MIFANKKLAEMVAKKRNDKSPQGNVPWTLAQRPGGWEVVQELPVVVETPVLHDAEAKYSGKFEGILKKPELGAKGHPANAGIVVGMDLSKVKGDTVVYGTPGKKPNKEVVFTDALATQKMVQPGVIGGVKKGKLNLSKLIKQIQLKKHTETLSEPYIISEPPNPVNKAYSEATAQALAKTKNDLSHVSNNTKYGFIVAPLAKETALYLSFLDHENKVRWLAKSSVCAYRVDPTPGGERLALLAPDSTLTKSKIQTNTMWTFTTKNMPAMVMDANATVGLCPFIDVNNGVPHWFIAKSP